MHQSFIKVNESVFELLSEVWTMDRHTTVEHNTSCLRRVYKKNKKKTHVKYTVKHNQKEHFRDSNIHEQKTETVSKKEKKKQIVSGSARSGNISVRHPVIRFQFISIREHEILFLVFFILIC